MKSPGRGQRAFMRGNQPSSDVELDTALELLSDPHRRAILRYLASTPGGSVESSTVVDYVVEQSSAERRTAEVECYHAHLPKLHEAGVIEFDPRTGDVRYRRSEAIEHLLDAISDVAV